MSSDFLVQNGSTFNENREPEKRRKKQLGDSHSCDTKAAEKQTVQPLVRNMLETQEPGSVYRGEDHKLKRSSVEGSTEKKKSLHELQMESPPGFKEFDARVN